MQVTPRKIPFRSPVPLHSWCTMIIFCVIASTIRRTQIALPLFKPCPGISFHRQSSDSGSRRPLRYAELNSSARPRAAEIPQTALRGPVCSSVPSESPAEPPCCPPTDIPVVKKPRPREAQYDRSDPQQHKPCH